MISICIDLICCIYNSFNLVHLLFQGGYRFSDWSLYQNNLLLYSFPLITISAAIAGVVLCFFLTYHTVS